MMADFYVLRLGKDSVADMRALDSLSASPSTPIVITFRCKQVPSDAAIGSYVFVWLGSDNNKGQPTDWKRGLRAMGKLVSKQGGPSYNDEWILGIDIPIVLPHSIDQHDLLDSAPGAYSDFSYVPILGLSASSQQAVQQIRVDEPRQNVAAILYTLAEIYSAFKTEAIRHYPDLSAYFKYTPKGLAGASSQQSKTTASGSAAQVGSLSAIVNDAHSAFLSAKFVVDRSLVHRFIASLMAKRFVILTGLSGSGKTKIAQAFAKWITPQGHPHNYVILAVGPDWTNSDAVLGYPDALNPGSYVTTPALDVILRAAQNPSLPYFLILDEMNLSHVERYFAPLLSSMESGESICLHNGAIPMRNGSSEIPMTIAEMPSNLFIVGTVNVDETTFMFSPKVLDRSNVIEFRLSSADLSVFMESLAKTSLDSIAGAGAAHQEQFVARAKQEVVPTGIAASKFRAEMRLFFHVMFTHGSEFGYRTAYEINRFLAFSEELATAEMSIDAAIDAQVLQKCLPRIHGSRRDIEPLLRALGGLCFIERDWKTSDGSVVLANESDIKRRAVASVSDEDYSPTKTEQDGSFRFSSEEAWHPKSFAKIQRLLISAAQHGFASFAEG
jgi:hypothetical protein